jgi:hypothetical protein
MRIAKYKIMIIFEENCAILYRKNNVTRTEENEYDSGLKLLIGKDFFKKIKKNEKAL